MKLIFHTTEEIFFISPALVLYKKTKIVSLVWLRFVISLLY